MPQEFESLLSPHHAEPQMPAPAPSVAGFSFAPQAALPALPTQPTQPAAMPVQPKQPPSGRLFSDAAGMRDRVFSRALTAAQNIQPISNKTHTLRVKDVSYIDPDQFTLAQQKQAILRRETIGRRLRGTWELVDNNSGEVLDSKQQTLARVPFFTQRGTTINNGSEYVMINQQRLKPGIFTREQSNGDLESHANVAVGTGASHRYYLDPSSGKFFLKVGQAKLPLMPLLRSLGATNEQLRENWGREIYASNEVEDDPKGLGKVFDKFASPDDRRSILDDAGKQNAIKVAFAKMQIDPEVSLRTLGKEHAGVDLDTVLATTKKLLAVSRREQDPDDRDHMANQQVLGAEDFIAERLAKDHGNLRRTALFKASLRGNLGAMQSGYLNKQIESALMGSGLAQPLEEVNALEVLDKRSKITRMGEGGIGSVTAIPNESRSVQPSHLGFIDPIRTVESLRAGVDLYLAGNALKGDDGKLYNQFINRKTGEVEDVSPEQMANSTILFSGEAAKAAKRGRTRAAGMKAGELGYYKLDEADYEMRRMEDGLSPLTNMLPFKGNSKGQRLAMGGRMQTQALPLINAEAPWVQAAIHGGDGKSYSEELGRQAGAVFAEQAGRVMEVTADSMTVKQDDGSTKSYELYNNMPSNRKSAWHNTPLVKPGDRVDVNSVLAKSNYTNDKGVVALGLNSRVAYMTAPSGSSNYEDAIAVSESYAKRLTSDHMYQHDLETHDALRTGKKEYISLYPGKFNKAQLDNFTDDGLIKPGTVVQYGDPLILGATETKLAPGKVHKKGQSNFKDATQTWDHHTEGVVTDVVQTSKGMTAIVKSTAATVLGDKLCFDPKTELMTKKGWKLVGDVTMEDKLATLNPETGNLEWHKPSMLHKFQHTGEMFSLESRHVRMLVTPNHELWVSRPGEDYRKVTAEEFHQSKGDWNFKKDCGWAGEEQAAFYTDVSYGEDGLRKRSNNVSCIPMDLWLQFLGYYIAEGRTLRTTAGGYQTQISQFRSSPHWEAINECLQQLGYSFTYLKNEQRFTINSRSLHSSLRACGNNAYNKKLPKYVKKLCSRQLRILFEAYMDGDGHRGAAWEYGTSSEKLSFDLEVLLLKIGYCGSPKLSVRTDNWQKKLHWRTRVNRSQRSPCWRNRKKQCSSIKAAAMVPYSGDVFCVTVENHLIYAKRCGGAHWSGNSGLYGDKGILTIVPDERMPIGEDGKPFEVLLNPLSLISRSNASQALEAQLGKIAALTGKAYKVEDFESTPDAIAFVQAELAKHGLKDTETVTDPETGRKIANVFTGNRYLMKLAHMAEDKGQGRGLGAYTSSGEPARGGDSGSKRLGLLDSASLLSHGAVNVLQDAGAVKGQQNDTYWLQFMQGNVPDKPKVPMVYEKFVSELKASGINVAPEGRKLRLMAMTDSDVDLLSEGREITTADTVRGDVDLTAIAGGLFDKQLTGGHGGKKWSYVKLAAPLPNPAFEEPIRKILGLTGPKFEAILAGKDQLNGKTGSEAIQEALAGIKLDPAIELTSALVKSGRGATRDAAIKKLNYLKSAKNLNMHPVDWMLTKVPVLPPAFRPISMMQGSSVPLISDANYLYKELISANNNLKELTGQLDDVGEERSAVYGSLKAVTGLGEPAQVKLQEKGVQGLLKHIVGSSPKMGTVSRKLIGQNVDLIGRAVVTPNADLDMDSVGLPEAKAWDVYKNFVVRRLKRNGMPLIQAMREANDRTPLAKKELLAEMSERPVILNRAPVWHKYGIMAFKPQLVKGDTIHISPLIVGGMSMDFDGDQAAYSLPVGDAARKEALEKMLPSRNLLSTKDLKSAMHVPSKEMSAGLYQLTADKSEKMIRTFATRQDALRALQSGEIDPGDRVSILS